MLPGRTTKRTKRGRAASLGPPPLVRVPPAAASILEEVEHIPNPKRSQRPLQSSPIRAKVVQRSRVRPAKPAPQVSQSESDMPRVSPPISVPTQGLLEQVASLFSSLEKRLSQTMAEVTNRSNSPKRAEEPTPSPQKSETPTKAVHFFDEVSSP